MIGLKGCWKRTKGCTLKYRLKELYWDIRYAWQRAWKGYDSRELFSMNDIFVDRYKEILKDFKKKNIAMFNIPEEYRYVFNKIHFNEEETDMIIDTMIFHLEMMDEDYVEKVLYGKNVYDDDYDYNKCTIERYRRISDVMNQNKNAFMKLFNIFFWDLCY